jgi:hypothetical protein
MRENRREALEQTKMQIWGLLVGCKQDEQRIVFDELRELLNQHDKRV